ncbi:MAG: WYL domain-containing protein [Clostridium sp.]|nr:WYL domain-containing protein [Clostridium sp.]
MTKSSNNVKFFSFVSILITYSNEEKSLSIKEINNYMMDKLGITLDRRTIYGYIKDMRKLGLSVSEYDKNKEGYYLKSNSSEQSELNIFTEIVDININDNFKTSYEEILINTHQLRECMKQNKKAIFYYKEHSEKLNDNEILNKYIVDPICLILNKDNYDLVFIDSSSEEIRNLPMNRISNVSISEEDMIRTEDILDIINTKIYVKEKS